MQKGRAVGPERIFYMQLVMIGSGYVGLVSGACLAEVGHKVCCVDLDDKKIGLLKDGHSPIYEPGLETLIRRNIEHERLSFSTELTDVLNQAEMAFIAVGTPEGEDGSADVSYVRKVAESIGQSVERDLIVVVKSTVPVGTCDMVEAVIQECLKERKANYKIEVVSNPEFLKEGAAIQDFMKPDRIIVGLNDGIYQSSFRDLYGPFILDDLGRMIFMDRRSSELTKYAANSMLATRISFMNEMSILCENLGANIDKVRLGIGADPRIGKKFLYSGPGYGGSCFPKDVAALLKTGHSSDVKLQVLQAVTDANETQKCRMAEKVINHFKDLRGKKIAIWGLTFKPGTDDVRESPATTIIQQLLDCGAFVIAHDPKGQENFTRGFGNHDYLSFASTAYGALHGADAVVLITEWSEYKRPNWTKVAELMHGKAVFDFRNQYNFDELDKLDFHYQSIGRPDSASRI